MTLATRLKNLQKKLGVTQRELAKRMKISKTYVGQICIGERKNVSALVLEKIEELEDSSKSPIARQVGVS